MQEEEEEEDGLGGQLGPSSDAFILYILSCRTSLAACIQIRAPACTRGRAQIRTWSTSRQIKEGSSIPKAARLDSSSTGTAASLARRLNSSV